MLWDRGWWEPEGDAAEGLERGNLKMRLYGEKMDGRWALVRMKGRDRGTREIWLLIKERDGRRGTGEDILARDRSVKSGRSLGEIAEGSPTQEGFSAAGRWPRTKDPDEGGPAQGGRTFEVGRASRLSPGPACPPDRRGARGRRLVARSEVRWLPRRDRAGGGAVRLFTRNAQDWTTRFARLTDAALALPCRSALIDGEVVAFDAEGRADFSTLQKHWARRHPCPASASTFSHSTATTLSGAPLDERKALLKALIEAGGEGPLL